MAAQPQITLKLVVDSASNCVVFAESGSEFVDLLLSFLTMPMGTIVRLADKETKLGSMDRLYEAVEALDDRYMQTAACREMLLRPRNSSECYVRNLVLKVDETRVFDFICPSWECSTGAHRLISNYANTMCGCNQMMERETMRRSLRTQWTAFVKGGGMFLVTDDLEVIPVTTTSTVLSMLKEHGLSDHATLEERTVAVTKAEVLQLLKHSLVSKTPLTNVFLLKSDTISIPTLDPTNLTNFIHPNEKIDPLYQPTNKISLKMFLSKSTNKVLFTESGGDFINLLFSYLTLPLGLIISLFDGHSCIGCVDNLHASIENLSMHGQFKSEACMARVRSPKLATHFSISNQLFALEEETFETSISKCSTCFEDCSAPLVGMCSHGLERVKLQLVNPKYFNGETKQGGGYVNESLINYLVTDEFGIQTLVPVACINLFNKMNVPINDIQEQVLSIGAQEAIVMLKACLFSESPLTHFFSWIRGKAAAKESKDDQHIQSPPIANKLTRKIRPPWDSCWADIICFLLKKDF